VATATIHLHPTAPLAPRALLPGDPGRALALAQTLLDEPKMFNHNRGLWGYTGTASDGRPLTIQSTGMGGPSAAIVLEELCDLGLQTAVRIGTCGALDTQLALGDLVVADEVLCADGASRALGAPERLPADAALTAALARQGARPGLVVSTDLFYDRDPARAHAWRRAGALAIEMEAAALLAVARHREIRVACLLGVSDIVPDAGAPTRIDADALAELGQRLGATAAQALLD
jgi:DeoD family purine-nucleoside phosphorylase